MLCCAVPRATTKNRTLDVDDDGGGAIESSQPTHRTAMKLDPNQVEEMGLPFQEGCAIWYHFELSSYDDFDVDVDVDHHVDHDGEAAVVVETAADDADGTTPSNSTNANVDMSTSLAQYALREAEMALYKKWGALLGVPPPPSLSGIGHHSNDRSGNDNIGGNEEKRAKQSFNNKPRRVTGPFRQGRIVKVHLEMSDMSISYEVLPIVSRVDNDDDEEDDEEEEKDAEGEKEKQDGGASKKEQGEFVCRSELRCGESSLYQR